MHNKVLFKGGTQVAINFYCGIKNIKLWGEKHKCPYYEILQKL